MQMMVKFILVLDDKLTAKLQVKKSIEHRCYNVTLDFVNLTSIILFCPRRYVR